MLFSLPFFQSAIAFIDKCFNINMVRIFRNHIHCLLFNYVTVNVHSSYTRTCNLQLQTKFLDHISDGISLVTGDVSQCNLHVQLPRILLVPGHHECPRHLLTLHQGELIVQVEHGLRPVGGDTPGYSTVQYSTVQYSTAQYSTIQWIVSPCTPGR